MSRIHKELQAEPDSEWFVRISDGSIYGPVDLTTLQSWAAQGRIEPENELSEDQERWIPAEALPALEMDWLVELEDGTLYGPFNIQLAPELLKRGALPPGSVVKHRETGETRALESDATDDLPSATDDEPEAPAPKRKRKPRAPRKKAASKPLAKETETTAEASEPIVSESEDPASTAPEDAPPPETEDPPPPESAEDAPAEHAKPEPTPSEDLGSLVTSADRQEIVAQRLEALQQSASQARTQLTNTRKELTEQRAATTAMQDQIRKLQEDVRNAEAEKENSERQLLEQQDMVAQAISEAENLNAQLQQLQDHYDRLQIESQNQFEALDQLRSESMQREQEYKRRVGREADRANAKTALLGQAMRLIIQDEDVEHGNIPPELLAGAADAGQLQELQARISLLQQQAERERKHTQTLEMQLASTRGSRTRNLLVLLLIILVLGLTSALAFVVGTRQTATPSSLRKRQMQTERTRREGNHTPVEAEHAALAGLIVTNTERAHREAPLPDSTAEYGELDLAPESDNHLPAATRELAAVTWPALRLPHGIVSKTDSTCKIVFTYGIFSSSTLMTPDAIRDLTDISNQIRGSEDEFTLLVEGHTDAMPISSQGAKYVDNFALGMARAEKVKDFLENECGLREGFIRTASAGESDPPHPNTSDESRRKNRTVVLTLTHR